MTIEFTIKLVTPTDLTAVEIATYLGSMRARLMGYHVDPQELPQGEMTIVPAPEIAAILKTIIPAVDNGDL